MPYSLLLAAIVAGYAAYYCLACWLAPFGPCRFHRGPTCSPCSGTGKRVRLGRRVHTWLRAEYRDGTR